MWGNNNPHSSRTDAGTIRGTENRGRLLRHKRTAFICADAFDTEVGNHSVS